MFYVICGNIQRYLFNYVAVVRWLLKPVKCWCTLTLEPGVVRYWFSNINLKGTLLAWRASPLSIGSYDRSLLIIILIHGPIIITPFPCENIQHLRDTFWHLKSMIWTCIWTCRSLDMSENICTLFCYSVQYNLSWLSGPA